MKTLKAMDDFEKTKENDPDFYESRISHYEWSPSVFMSEYIVSPTVNMEELRKDINQELAKSGIKTKFIESHYSKNKLCNWDDIILSQLHPLRKDSEGGATGIILCPANKADGIKYLKNQLNIPYSEILMSGDGDNDISMAELSKKGAYFICLNNASDKLKQISSSLKEFFNIIMAKNDGNKGIAEGISEISKS